MIFSWGSLALCLLLIYLFAQLPSVKKLADYQYQVPMRIYSNDHQLMAEFGHRDCLPVTLDNIPKTMQQAIIAIEDHRFYDHYGVDFIGLARAAKNLFHSGQKSQGGSTITMQVARNFFLSREKTYLRKINEILLSFNIEAHFSKQEILEMYLNKIYFGKQAYGIQAAAQNYYGKDVSALTLAESAMLAGLPKAPSRNNPIDRPQKAIARRNQVLSNMHNLGFIDHTQYQNAIQEEDHATFHHQKPAVSAPYAAELIRQKLVEKLGQDAYTTGIEVITTIDPIAQKSAHKSAVSQLVKYAKSQHLWHLNPSPVSPYEWLSYLRKLPYIEPYQVGIVTTLSDDHVATIQTHNQTYDINLTDQISAQKDLFIGAVVLLNGDQHLVPISPAQIALVSTQKNGALVAMQGGLDYRINPFNRVTQGKRQPGSLIKPFIFASALENGYTLASIINDAPIIKSGGGQNIEWRPNNDDRNFSGALSLRQALTKSRNLVSIRIVDQMGIPNVKNALAQMGFNSDDIPNDLSLSLGSMSTTPLTINSAFSLFQNYGQPVTPFLVTHISSTNTPDLKQQFKEASLAPGLSFFAQEANQRVISPETAFLIADVLNDVVQKGTARRAKSLKRHDLYGKTGTTNQKHDAWFTGFTADYTTTVWMGYDQNIHLNAYGSQAALPVWIDFMKTVLTDTDEKTLVRPESIISIRTNPETGEPSANPNHPFELYSEAMI